MKINHKNEMLVVTGVVQQIVCLLSYEYELIELPQA
jgi:hypothetical protein